MLDIANSATGGGLVQQEQVSISDINPVLIAKKIVDKYNFVIDQDTKLLWIYDNNQGIYTQDSEEVIKREIVKLLDNYAKARFYVDVDFWIRYSAPKVKMHPHPELLGVANGVLNVITRELKPYDQCKDLFVTVKIPTKYDKNAQCPGIR
jgi:phage/plasmid-associated DNA primase